nr:unnamed protein product [Callosobruchus analis]
MGRDKAKEDSRQAVCKPIKYTNPKILIGNWFEEQCAYKKNRYTHSSEYQNEYRTKPLTTYPKSIIWDAKLRSDYNVCPDKHSDEDPSFFNNFSTTYDLSYNHLPQFYRRLMKDVPNENAPSKEMELIESYGNLTNYGLVNEKKYEWRLDSPDPRMTTVTSNKCDFARPDDNSYKFTRWTLPTPVKGKCGQYFRPFPDNHPRTDKFDPIKSACLKSCDDCRCMDVKFSQ